MVWFGVVVGLQRRLEAVWLGSVSAIRGRPPRRPAGRAARARLLAPQAFLFLQISPPKHIASNTRTRAISLRPGIQHIH